MFFKCFLRLHITRHLRIIFAITSLYYYNGSVFISYYEKINGEVVDITDEIPFNLPESWSWCRGYMLFAGMEIKKPSGEIFRYIDIDSIDNKSHTVTEPKKIKTVDAPSRASRAIQAGSTVFSLVRPYLENIAYIDESNADCIASTGFYICNSNGSLDSRYLFFLMISPYVVSGLNQFMKGDNSPSIGKNNIEKWLYPVPPFQEQTCIVKCVEKFIERLEWVEESLS